MSVTEAEPRLQQLWMWWLSIDQTMQQVLDDISVLAPQAVAQVLGGPDEALVTAPQGTKFSEHLWAQLSAASPDDDGHRRPKVVLSVPFHLAFVPASGSDVKFEWEVTNQGSDRESAGDASHRALVIIQDQTGAVVASQEETVTTPPAGGSVACEVVFSGVSDGSFWAKLFMPYHDGAESTPGAEASPALSFVMGDASDNLPLGADNLGTMLWAIADRLAAASELAAAGAPETGSQIQQSVTELNELLISVGADGYMHGGYAHMRLDPGFTQSVLSRASTALGRFADRAPELLRESQATNASGRTPFEDSRDLAEVKAAIDQLR